MGGGIGLRQVQVSNGSARPTLETISRASSVLNLRAFIVSCSGCWLFRAAEQQRTFVRLGANSRLRFAQAEIALTLTGRHGDFPPSINVYRQCVGQLPACRVEARAGLQN